MRCPTSKFIIDVEIWSYIKRIATPISTARESLAVDVIKSSCGDYLSEDHTLEHMRENRFEKTNQSGLLLPDGNGLRIQLQLGKKERIELAIKTPRITPI